MVDNTNIREIIIKTNPQTALLYIILLSHRNMKTNKCYPSKALLGRELGLCGRTIGSMITELHDIGAIEINSGKMGFANSYYFPAEDFYEDFKKDTFQASPYRRKGRFKKQATTSSRSELPDSDTYDEQNSSDPDPF